MINKTLLAALPLFLFAFCSQAMSQEYTLGYDSSRYDALSGETVDLTILLTEDISGGGTSRLAAGNNDGLFAFSLGLDYSNFTGGTNGSTFASLILDDRFTTGFAGSDEDVTDDPGLISFEGTENFAGNDTDGETGVGGTMLSATQWQLELATLTFNAGDAGTITELNLREHVSPDANEFLFGDGATPVINFASSEIVVAVAIPEPGSAAVIALFAGFGLIRRRRS